MSRPFVASAKNMWRERGYNDGFAGREKLTEFPDDAARVAYLAGYRHGQKERARHNDEVEASR